MGTATRLDTATPSIGRQWQFPLLIGAAALFLLGFVRLVPLIPHPKPADPIETVRATLKHGEFASAFTQAVHLLDQPGHSPTERITLHRIAAESIWRLERGMKRHLPENGARIVDHLKQAAASGATLDATESLRMGEALLWLARPGQAITAFKDALAKGIAGPAPIRRKLVGMIESTSPDDTKAVEAQVDAILADARTEPDDLHWALQRRLERMVEAGQTKPALELIRDATPRLAGSIYKQDLLYEQARCVLRVGRPEEADRLLRELRNGWGPKDDLWARAGLLLAKLQQEDGRPEAALSLYDEIQIVFPSGPRFAEGLFGRGESLVALERIEEAAETFDRLGKLAEGPSTDLGDVNRDAVRARLTTLADQFRNQNRPEAGLAFTRMAMRLLNTSDDARRSVHELRIADLCEQLAQRAARDEKAAKDVVARQAAANRKSSLYRQAGAALAGVARNVLTNDAESSAAAWRATQAYDAAGDAEETARLLEEFTRQRLADMRRPSGLYRLGRIRQVQGAYRQAADAFDELVREYPLTNDGLHAVVLLADCLASLGGPGVDRAEKLLLSMVEQSPERDALFDPRAPEFAEALFKLAELYATRGRSEDAIYRLETLLALPPTADVPLARARYMLADAYRASGLALLAELAKTTNAELRDRITREGRERLSHAIELYAQTIDRNVVDETRLAPLERTQLRSAWMNRADCLFDLGRHAEARDVYAEAAWRFDGEYIGLTALLGVTRCHRRMGQKSEAKAVLARMQVLCRRMPEAAFSAEAGTASKAEWQARIDGLLAAESDDAMAQAK